MSKEVAIETQKLIIQLDRDTLAELYGRLARLQAAIPKLENRIEADRANLAKLEGENVFLSSSSDTKQSRTSKSL